ncbi:hypothetical protein F4824DRAFT_496476 [Ustulina deusta]|nr:hypothetical protein F4824DRAFT_496476 [Ustulina deusta]
MTDGITAAFDSSQTILGGLQPLREAVRTMRNCIDRIDQRMDQSEARLTALESNMVVRVANKQTADAGQQPQEPLRIASNEESDSLARLVAEMGNIRVLSERVHKQLWEKGGGEYMLIYQGLPVLEQRAFSESRMKRKSYNLAHRAYRQKMLAH